MKYPEIKAVCCYGVGIIGAGWATNLGMCDVQVNMFNAKQTSLDKARTLVEQNFAALVEGEMLTAAAADKAMACIHYITDAEQALSNVQMVLESVSERYEVKEEVLKVVDQYCGADVIVGSSSSSLLISKMAPYSKYPERVICTHPYNPTHLIPLVELVGIEGSDDAIAHAKAFLLKVGKKPIVLKKETKGYIANRLQVVVGREIVELVQNRGVCSVEDAEIALTYGPGIRWAIMGHNQIMQLGGGAGGIKGMFEKVVAKGSDRSSYLDDLGNWIKYPDDWPEVAQAGIDEAMANRAPGTGHDNASLAAYRDKMLIEMLKLHQNVRVEEGES